MLTIKEPLVQEEKILSSRFIGVLQPLLGADFKEAKAKIEELYPKATHYCYAYKKGANEGSSDDGEPSHSAGLPILNVLRGSGLDECAIFVVRYFGGTKLGLGRLTHAYSDLGKALVAKAEPYEVAAGRRAVLAVPYPSYDLVLDRAKRMGLEIEKPTFGESIVLPVRADATILSAFLALFPELRVAAEEECFIYRRPSHDQG